MPLRRLFAALLLLFSAPVVAAPPEPVAVTVSRGTDGSWRADYRFAERAGAWVFLRSNPAMDGAPWRLESWTVETPGVSLVRIGRWDALIADRGPVPARVRIRMTPFARALRADYTPALMFSDGGIAWYSDQFTVAPRATLSAVGALPDDLSALPGLERPNRVILDDPGHRVVAKGVVAKGRAERLAGDPDLYFYTGDAPIAETAALAGIFDPGLPAWLREDIDSYAPRLFDLYRDRLGPPKGGRPMALVAWRGASEPGVSFSGSVLTGTVVMAIDGKQVLARSPEAAERMRWFLGHEGAHFWMGQTIGYTNRAGAWITEGSADLMALRALERLVPGFDPKPDLQSALDDCLKLNGAGIPLATAEARGQTRANYACGAILALVAEGTARGRDPAADVFTFLRGLIDANRADGRIDAKGWIAAFVAGGGDPALAARIRAFAARGDADPAAMFAQALTASGIAVRREGDRLLLR